MKKVFEKIKGILTNKQYGGIVLMAGAIVGTFLLMILAVSVLLGKGVLGWFSKNHRVDANGASVSAYYKEPVVTLISANSSGVFTSSGTMKSDGSIDLNLGIPGEKRYFLLDFTNPTNEVITVTSVFLEPTDSEEQCATVSSSGVYSWLSAQLSVRAVLLNSVPSAPLASSFSSGATSVPIADSSYINTSSSEPPRGTCTIYDKPFTVPANNAEHKYLLVEVTFVNSTTFDQSIFRTDRTDRYWCSRKFSVYYE